ncbi:alpha/beta hydrolase-fold protein [Kordiimonas aestuarii]|uniref:alpha/beta hydrolase-fold protein n=1 Tax=Kordiimonas aestuarii TaxID=1005925 RepID=UPI0021D16F6B|nr:alpha/beta hydrolase-fold protein [Kordiimonas aestuarii]
MSVKRYLVTRVVVSIAMMLFAVFVTLLEGAARAGDRFEVSLPDEAAGNAVTGRLLVALTPHDDAAAEVGEPRNAISVTGATVFGMDVSAFKPGSSVWLDAKALKAGARGYPYDALTDIPPGQYDVQAVLIPYTEVTRSDGHTVWVPISDRRVMPMMMPGNPYSKPVTAKIGGKGTVKLALTETIAPLPEPKDTEWLKHVRIRSQILSDFWGTEMYLRANVLLPKGFDENERVRYPAVYPFGHGDVPFGFNPNPESHTERAIASRADANVETGYAFFQAWTSDDFPRVVAITLEHPSPYFVESYAVNSANNGPYGEAITRELIPYLEREFRLIAEPYARIVEGASTGGWEAMALQLYYPDFFGGAWVFNPDPIDFRRYQLVNIYEVENMFSLKVAERMWADRPFRRSREGQPLWTVRQLASFEAVLGSKGRSGYQLGIWQATHGPVGDDGYPVPLFDDRTGAIDKAVAAAYRAHGYDLTAYVRDNWETLSPKVAGKLVMIAGEMDDFYLNLSVYGFEDTVRELGGDDYPIRFEYGRPKKGHNWHHTTWEGVVREMADHIRANAPEGADATRWNYK